MLTDELECTCGPHVFNALGEVGAEQEGEVYEGRAVELKDGTNFGPRDEGEGCIFVRKISDEGGFVYEDVLCVTSRLNFVSH